MNNKNSIILILILFCGAQDLKLEASTYYRKNNNINKSQKLNIIELPSFNNDSLVSIYTKPAGTYYTLGIFGIGVDVKISNLEGRTSCLKDGSKIWRLGVKSESALGMILHFRNLQIPSGAKLYITSRKTNAILDSLAGNGSVLEKYSSPKLIGNEFVISMYQPAQAIGKFKFEIPRATYIFTHAGHSGQALTCHNNVNCSPWISDFCYELRSVVKIEYHAGGENYSSGTAVLVNNTNNNYHPYFLTAAHVVNGMANHADVKIFFNWQSPTCTNSAGNDQMTIKGINVLGTTTWDYSYCPDVAIFEALEPVPIQYTPFYAGWERPLNFDELNNTNGIVIHHPRGDIKKITQGTISADRWITEGECLKFQPTSGTIESGSSGSPLFYKSNPNLPQFRIIAVQSQIDNGPATCNNMNSIRGRFGKLGVAWYKIWPYLAPDLEYFTGLDGIDPISSCQDNIEIKGPHFPGLDWMLKNQIIIQAASTITAGGGNKETKIQQSPANMATINHSDYVYRAGSEIILLPGFSVVSSNNFRAHISTAPAVPCETYAGCGFNYLSKITNNHSQETNDPNDFTTIPTFEADKIIVYPNPILDKATIRFSLTASSFVKIKLFNMQCLDIETITNNTFEPGTHKVSLNSLNIQSGTYLLEVCINGICSQQKIIKL